MNVREPRGGKGNNRQTEMSVAMYFAGLTREAGAAPKGIISGKMGPDISGREEATRSPNAWMSQAINMLVENMSKRLRDKGTKNGGGEITKERGVADHMSVNLERWRIFESLNFRTGGLLLGEMER